jgi:hypothetical protein
MGLSRDPYLVPATAYMTDLICSATWFGFPSSSLHLSWFFPLVLLAPMNVSPRTCEQPFSTPGKYHSHPAERLSCLASAHCRSQGSVRVPAPHFLFPRLHGQLSVAFSGSPSLCGFQANVCSHQGVETSTNDYPFILQQRQLRTFNRAEDDETRERSRQHCAGHRRRVAL